MPVLVGSLEILGGIEIILPAISWFNPILSPISLFGLTVLIAAAYAVQVWSGGNTGKLAIVLMFLSLELGWLRLKVIPIAAKTMPYEPTP